MYSLGAEGITARACGKIAGFHFCLKMPCSCCPVASWLLNLLHSLFAYCALVSTSFWAWVKVQIQNAHTHHFLCRIGHATSLSCSCGHVDDFHHLLPACTQYQAAKQNNVNYITKFDCRPLVLLLSNLMINWNTTKKHIRDLLNLFGKQLINAELPNVCHYWYTETLQHKLFCWLFVLPGTQYCKEKSRYSIHYCFIARSLAHATITCNEVNCLDDYYTACASPWESWMIYFTAQCIFK